MADKYSAESHISADPRFEIENIARRESNSVFLYISYEDRQVLLWVLKANGDIFFRKTDEVKIDTLIAEQVCEVEGVFKKSAKYFGVLPTANCEDLSLDDNMTTSLHEESQTLEKRGTFPYKLLTYLLCSSGKFRDALYAEELGRTRVLAELMADKYSAESHISADPRFGIENIARRESNSVFLYISYEDRQVLLWVLKANGDIFFRKTDEVKIDTLIAEQVCEVEGVFKKSAKCFVFYPQRTAKTDLWVTT